MKQDTLALILINLKPSLEQKNILLWFWQPKLRCLGCGLSGLAVELLEPYFSLREIFCSLHTQCGAALSDFKSGPLSATHENSRILVLNIHGAAER